jgi:hypothetical protein
MDGSKKGGAAAGGAGRIGRKPADGNGAGSAGTGASAGVGGADKRTAGPDRTTVGSVAGGAKSGGSRAASDDRDRRDSVQAAKPGANGASPAGTTGSGTGAEAKTEPSAQAQTRIEVVDSQGGASKKRGPYKKTAAARAASPENGLSATIVVGLLEMLATNYAGPEAAMSAEQKTNIEQPLARMLTRIDPATSAALQVWADPISLAVSLLLYGITVMAIHSAKEPAKPAEKINAMGERVTIQSNPTATQVAASNGNDPTSVPETMFSLFQEPVPA